MNNLTYDQVLEQLKEKQLHYYNFYNNDIKYSVQQTCRWYANHENDVIANFQPIHALYLDIEVYNNNQGMSDEDVDNGTNPINIVTIYDDQEKKFQTYLLLFQSNIEAFGIKSNQLTNEEWIKFITDRQQYYINELRNRKYINNEFIPDLKNDQLEVHIYLDEKKLLQELWKHIHELDPDILTSWNGDKFDYWYIYNRCKTLFGEENVGKILSKFGKVTINNKMVQFCEYSVADLLYFYRPRDEGGMSYGKKQPEYKLDYIAEQELGLRKVEYIEKGMTLDDFFIQNPIESTLYNIVDVVLIVGLSNKLQFFDLHNQIRRAMYTPLQMSIIGSSALYDSFIFSQLDKENKKIRGHIVTENNISFPIEYTSQFGSIKSGKKLINPIKISAKEFASVSKKYPGAYVKQPYPEIIADQTMIIDLDASLPPWETIYYKRKSEYYNMTSIQDYQFQEGDTTLTWDNNNRLCERKILGKSSHDWDGDLITVEAFDTFREQLNPERYAGATRSCQVTDNHSIFGVKCEDILKLNIDPNETDIIINDPKLITQLKAGSLGIGDWIVARPCTLENNTNCIHLKKIRHIYREKYVGKVYDISVEETERFFAGAWIGVHNTSMYPSNIKQGNISFDTYVARIIPPQCYPTINLLKSCLGRSQYPAALIPNIQKMVYDYIEKKESNNKTEQHQKFYYSILSLFKKLAESGKTFEEITDPHTDEEILLLKNNLIPLIDIMFTIHPTTEVYNLFVYDYVYYGMDDYKNIFGNKEAIRRKYNDIVWVITNPNECNTQLISMDIDGIYQYIQQYNVSFSGCMFLKHDTKKGLFIDMLTDFAVLRKNHKKLRDTYEKGSQEYKFEDNNQNVFKRLMNTCYGLYGLSTFRYSNNWLARSITNNSLHALKCAIYKGEEYLTELIKDQI